ncbi:hypothetical protein LOZ61_006781 [Ophidiomyces ophidiicola]|nr:hypothetical protein LOZ61_006781 [Ophidiomyces ophidiicola]
MATCIACGSTLADFEFQSRAADEAHTVITTCPYCPVNPNKIDAETMPKPSLRGMVRPLRRSLPLIRQAVSLQKTGYTLTVDIPSDSSLNNMKLEERYLVQQVSAHKRSISESYDDRTVAMYYATTGLFAGCCTQHSSSKVIGMGITLDRHNIYAASPPAANYAIMKAVFCRFMTVPDYECYVYEYHGERKRVVIAQLGNEQPSNMQLETVINSIYANGLLPISTSQYIHKDMILRMSNLSPRAWDTTFPPTSGHLFTSKPDGQRVWLIWYGNMWYMCNPRCKGGVGLPSPGIRDVEWIVTQYYKLMERRPGISVQLRRYFNSHEDAMRYSKMSAYPTDGTVAIRNGSTEILKIKSLKSMELVLSDDGYLLTGDGSKVVKCPAPCRFNGGDILEIRFIVSQLNRGIEIYDIFKRIDKTIANSDIAVSNIVRSGITATTPDDNERRVALLWCNDIRREIAERAVSRQSNKSIVVDVGTGTGQGLDSIPNLDTTSYVFIEPDANKCRKLANRLGTKRTLTRPYEIVPMIRSLKTRSVRNVIINCTLGDLLDDEDAHRALFSETKSIISTFSAHFVIDDLHEIAATCQIPIYACTYAYDGVDSKGVLINSCGVLMKIERDNVASVKWGRDIIYEEPVTHKRDYAGIGNVLPGYDIIQLPSFSLAPGANSICKHVIAIMP